MRAILCSFSGQVGDMKRADQADPLKVLRVLAKCGKFSSFEASENETIGRTVTALYHSKDNGGPLLKMDHSMGYPMTKVVLTEAGSAFLAAAAIAQGAKHD